jgi:mannose-6-phosphate isomerase-like protein (cupin superfamily)
MRYALSADESPAIKQPGETVTLVTLFDDSRGCEKFAQRLLRVSAGSSGPRVEAGADEVLYVLAGEGRLCLDEVTLPLAPGIGVSIRRGSSWVLETETALELLSVLLLDPPPAPAAYAHLDLAAEGRRSATAARQFTLGVRPELGGAALTQFIGYVPPGRAPDHYHHYDEVIYILSGEGVLHIGGEQAALAPGSCVHLPARLVHCLENSGERELELLGVFTPAGSPAEAYYPDGTPATYPKES